MTFVPEKEVRARDSTSEDQMGFGSSREHETIVEFSASDDCTVKKIAENLWPERRSENPQRFGIARKATFSKAPRYFLTLSPVRIGADFGIRWRSLL